MPEESCKICLEKERQIAFLKEQLRESDSRRKELEDKIVNLIEHYTGMKRQNINPDTLSHEMRPLQRKTQSIQSRIGEAEKASFDAVLSEKRKKEYNERIADIMNGESKIRMENE